MIKLVFEVNPLKCPACAGTMKIVSFIENSRQPEVVEKILTAVRKGGKEYGPCGSNPLCPLPFLRHCGLWKDTPKCAPPHAADAQRPADPDGLVYDECFFDRQCA